MPDRSDKRAAISLAILSMVAMVLALELDKPFLAIVAVLLLMIGIIVASDA